MNSCVSMTGKDVEEGIMLKTNDELYDMAEEGKNSFLMHQATLNQMHACCYFREYLPCAILAEKLQVSKEPKRSGDFLIALYSGICKYQHVPDLFWQNLLLHY